MQGEKKRGKKSVPKQQQKKKGRDVRGIWSHMMSKLPYLPERAGRHLAEEQRPKAPKRSQHRIPRTNPDQNGHQVDHSTQRVRLAGGPTDTRETAPKMMSKLPYHRSGASAHAPAAPIRTQHRIPSTTQCPTSTPSRAHATARARWNRAEPRAKGGLKSCRSHCTHELGPDPALLCNKDTMTHPVCVGR